MCPTSSPEARSMTAIALARLPAFLSAKVCAPALSSRPFGSHRVTTGSPM